MRMLRVLAGFGSIVAVLALAGQVSPIEHPNLSGTWKLNVARSGPILPRGTEALTMTYEHRDLFRGVVPGYAVMMASGLRPYRSYR